ncbi:MAG: PqiC family protein [Opitutaceae bacterium]
MKHPRRPLLLLPFALAGLLSGCLNTTPAVDARRHFVLDNQADIQSASGAVVKETTVGLMPVLLPSYLHDNRLTVRKSGTEVVYLEQDRWAGRLDQGLSQFIGNRVEENLEGVSVLQAPWNRGDVDYELRIKYSRCEVTTEGLAVVAAEWSCTDQSVPRNSLRGQVRIERPGPSPYDSTAASIATLSDANRELAADIARTIRSCIDASKAD